MSDVVHLLIPFAGRPAAQGLKLPQLEKLLARLAPQGEDLGEATSLSPPHERVLARAWLIAAPDGQIPWAAREAGRPGAWAWITPCRWDVGREHVAMTSPAELRLTAEESQALLAAMRPYFEQDGLHLQYSAPTTWLARGDIFRGLATASLDRVIGRMVGAWQPQDARTGPLRRLQQEMQMLLYTDATNEDRQARGLPPVNSFWISGTGELPAASGNAAPTSIDVADDLRGPALADDDTAWRAAWQQLDAREGARLNAELSQGRPVTLTLCGERHARTWSSTGADLRHKVLNLFTRPSTPALLESL